jgi:chaperonin cofactor prefoldin
MSSFCIATSNRYCLVNSFAKQYSITSSAITELAELEIKLTKLESALRQVSAIPTNAQFAWCSRGDTWNYDGSDFTIVDKPMGNIVKTAVRNRVATLAKSKKKLMARKNALHQDLHTKINQQFMFETGSPSGSTAKKRITWAIQDSVKAEVRKIRSEKAVIDKLKT